LPEGEGEQLLMINGNVFELLEPGGKGTSKTHSHVLQETHPTINPGIIFSETYL